MNQRNQEGKPQYVISPSGHAAHPDDIIASCQALQAHIAKMQEDSRNLIRSWEDGIKEQELAEKRRVAPGWLVKTGFLNLCDNRQRNKRLTYQPQMLSSQLNHKRSLMKQRSLIGHFQACGCNSRWRL
jgi:hypothetical protein